MSVVLAHVLHTGFLFALLIVFLSLYYGGKILRRVMSRLANANGGSRDARIKAAQAKKLADNQAAIQPARVEFANALENQKRGIALIRPYPPRNLPSSRSRIGGLPDLPRSIAWPRVSQDNDRRVKKGGYPLHFIAQLDLSELPQIDSLLPVSGTLFFFAHLDEELGWSGSKNSVRVLFDPQSEGHRVPPPDNITPVFDGGSDYQDDFGIDGDIHHTILNEWPLLTGSRGVIERPWHLRRMLTLASGRGKRLDGLSSAGSAHGPLLRPRGVSQRLQGGVALSHALDQREQPLAIEQAGLPYLS